MQRHEDLLIKDKADLKKYKIELKRRRQIGLTIDPAIAETTYWGAHMNDPYGILDERYHKGKISREYFARNPDEEWVHFKDLPEATRKVLWERDGHKLVWRFVMQPVEDTMNQIPSPDKYPSDPT